MGGGRVGGGGQGGCERIIKVFVKIKKKNRRGGGGRGRIGGGGGGHGGCEIGIKVFVKIQKKKYGCERNVGVRGDVGYGGCEPRIEGFVRCTKRYCTILRKFKNVGGGRGRGDI